MQKPDETPVPAAPAVDLTKFVLPVDADELAAMLRLTEPPPADREAAAKLIKTQQQLLARFTFVAAELKWPGFSRVASAVVARQRELEARPIVTL